jgi:hypothetical protein
MIQKFDKSAELAESYRPIGTACPIETIREIFIPKDLHNNSEP